MRQIFVGAAALLGLLTGSAVAADLAEPEVVQVMDTVPVGAFSWSGAYVGANAGYAWGHSKWDISTTTRNVTNEPSSFIGGVQAGYQYQFSNGLLVGAEAGWQWLDGDDKSRCPNPAFRCGTRIDWLADIRAKAGYGYDRFLVYAAGGVSFADVNIYARPKAGGFSRSKTATGWNIGAGLDYAVTDNVVLGVEYKYADLGKVSYGNVGGARVKDRLYMHAVTARVSYKFDTF
jgi:outer membrane immunogenic protein